MKNKTNEELLKKYYPLAVKREISKCKDEYVPVNRRNEDERA